MVGVPKSTGCAICRKRKIKCDETWPKCVNCQKNGKCCPGPPARHTFRDTGLRLNKLAVAGRETNTLDLPHRLTQIHERWSDNGAVAHKFRITHKQQPKQLRSPRSNSTVVTPARPSRSPLYRIPSPSRHQELARALVEALETGGAGHRMSAFGPFIRDVPSRLGHNTALDTAVACLISAHSTLVHQEDTKEIVDPGLYMRAVQTLQTKLEDPQQFLSSNTLCASVLLGIVEALAGPRSGNRYLAHVGGAGRLMEIQGPRNCEDQFAKEILRFNRGGLIITSIYKRKPCFLTLPGWRDIAFDTTGLSFDDCLYTGVLHRMAEFPALLEEFKELDEVAQQPSNSAAQYNFNVSSSAQGLSLGFPPEVYDPRLVCSSDSFTMDSTRNYENAKNGLLGKLHHLKDALSDIGRHLTAKLVDGSAAVELPAIEKDSPIPTALHFSNWRVAVAYNCYWSLLILVNKKICQLLPPYDPTQYALEAESRTVAYHICKTWEDAWDTRPIGAFHVPLGFVLAHGFCTPDVQEWIVKGLNALLEQQHVDNFRWSDDVIHMMSGKLAGEGLDLVFSNVKL
ncbi:hypothetical protein CC80DRAFT_852 [Byssothecium circinans]|uniref:Zn(2)-C6 fungal-type domain-containing protein n=1 Tax=Byssothecium circinans TaxID=147558 RepID=A0A6A5UH40_9PLEO|nr:hypothetical protein CC80DRAFT_852 [Byssothecium circinans]